MAWKEVATPSKELDYAHAIYSVTQKRRHSEAHALSHPRLSEEMHFYFKQPLIYSSFDVQAVPFPLGTHDWHTKTEYAPTSNLRRNSAMDEERMEECTH